MPLLYRVELFGGLRLKSEHEVVTRFPSQKAGLLLAYLALKVGKPQSREHVIDLLWPEVELNVGRNNLSTLLSFLRRVLEPGATPAGTTLVADRQSIALNRETLDSDVAEFERLREKAAQIAEVPSRLPLLVGMIALGSEELLPGVYEEWAVEARTYYAEHLRLALRQKVQILFDLKRFDEAQADAAQLLKLDECDNEACEFLMRAAALAGQPERAFAAYSRLETALRENFDALPDASVKELREALLRSPEQFAPVRTPRSDSLSSISPPSGTEDKPPRIAEAEPTAEDKSFVSKVPVPISRFFGRESELETLCSLLVKHKSRLVTILGTGGAGKTRLSLHLAQKLASEFANRVLFVSFADIGSPVLMPLLLQNALELPNAPGDPLERVIEALTEKPTLLILDNMEHLLEDRETKSEHPHGNSGRVVVKLLLDKIPTLQCLVTSRQALGLEGEQEFYLPSLSFPMPEDTHLCLTEYASVALYVDRAQKSKADFALTAHNAEAICALCRKLEGMPLAIEMAAAWVKTLPPARVLEKLEHQLEVLVSRRRDLPARHQSLRATCEWSYGQLTRELQYAYAMLSLFQGGWTLEAAEALIGLNAMEMLAELQERSLVLMVEDFEVLRYRMLEPLREFGREKLHASGEEAQAQKTHATYFLTFAEMAREQLRGREEKLWLARLKQEQQNLRLALHWAEDNDSGMALRFLAALVRYWELTGAFVEGCHCGARILALPGNEVVTETRATALNGLGTISMLQAEYARAIVYHDEAVSQYIALGNRAGQASALHGLGNIFFYRQDYEQAREYYEGSLDIRLKLKDARALGSSYHSLGNLAMRKDDYETAVRHFEEALALRQTCGDEVGVAYTLGALGQIAYQQEDYETALRYYREVTQQLYLAEIPWTLALSLQNIAQAIEKRGQIRETVCLFGAVQKMRDSTNYQVPPAERASRVAELAELRTRLGEAEFGQAWAEGNAMSLTQVVRYALSVSENTAVMPPA